MVEDGGAEQHGDDRERLDARHGGAESHAVHDA